MNQSAVEALRNSLIAAQFCTDPTVRGLALRRFELAEGEIASRPDDEQDELHAQLLHMLPSDWPLWVENAGAFNAIRVYRMSDQPAP